ncbi:type II DNA topoisomerase, partial [Aureobasidium melanogenum]|uniref:DNA topoisomerase (ATP-hydrolyzing) n=1 Tax=Aureobasidium melanogenum (strain CBS 110374) TaxID=1043003 RepID=A0A074VW59_AURM1
MTSVDKEQLTIPETHPYRCVPSVRDGLIPTQRKILHTLLQQKSGKEIKVDKLACNVSVFYTRDVDQFEIQKDIIKLAQNFVGANNINYLKPEGWFGSRREGGQDAVSGRYIYTQLSDVTRSIFIEEDDCLLVRRVRKGKTGEPRTLMPVLPMILVNGYEASGQGWQTRIPPYNPRDIIENLRRRMRGGSKDGMQSMQPWFRNWTGHVETIDQGQYSMKGEMHKTSESVMEITELPPRLWTQDFKSELDKYISEPQSQIRKYTEHPSSQGVRFVLETTDLDMDTAAQRNLEARLNLLKTITTDSLVALDESGKVQKYATDLDILKEFYLLKLQTYKSKKYLQLSALKKDLTKWTDQSKFAKLLLEGDLDISQDQDTLAGELIHHGLIPIENFDELIPTKKRERDADNKPAVPGYEHLFEMTVASMLPGPMKVLETSIASKKAQIAELDQISVEEIWEADLVAFEGAWKRQLEHDRQNPPRTCKRCGGLGCG